MKETASRQRRLHSQIRKKTQGVDIRSASIWSRLTDNSAKPSKFQLVMPLFPHHTLSSKGMNPVDATHSYDNTKGINIKEGLNKTKTWRLRYMFHYNCPVRCDRINADLRASPGLFFALLFRVAFDFRCHNLSETVPRGEKKATSFSKKQDCFKDCQMTHL